MGTPTQDHRWRRAALAALPFLVASLAACDAGPPPTSGAIAPARQDLPAGAFIYEYVGEVSTFMGTDTRVDT